MAASRQVLLFIVLCGIIASCMAAPPAPRKLLGSDQAAPSQPARGPDGSALASVPVVAGGRGAVVATPWSRVYSNERIGSVAQVAGVLRMDTGEYGTRVATPLGQIGIPIFGGWRR